MGTNKSFGYGAVRDIPKNAEESRIVSFVLSTYKKDRHGTVLNQDNWNLDNYRKNPLFAYQHMLSGGMCTDPDPDNIIGKSLRTEIEGSALVADGQFEPADMNPMAEKIFRKVLFGSLSRTSVGFMEVGEGKYGNGKEARGQEEETYYFNGQELLEWSIVNIPSNPEAGKRDITMRKFREEGYAALMYAWKELGAKFRLSQIEQLRVCDILDLLDGKDLDIKETDPDRVRKILAENEALKDQVARFKELRGLK
jgi:hypothetical protein